jgi:hypothetical protein
MRIKIKLQIKKITKRNLSASGEMEVDLFSNKVFSSYLDLNGIQNNRERDKTARKENM